MPKSFKLAAPFEPAGDQGPAIDRLVKAFNDGIYAQTLLGVTGSGKTFTVAKVIEQLNRPTLVLSHNKTLAAQLYQEFKAFFPENAVEYFVSYYDYYQPEAYVPSSDTYIEKETSINEEIDRLRLAATRALFERRDVLIIASVSCIYGLGDPNAYYGMLLLLEPGGTPGMDAVLRQLVAMQYERTQLDLVPGAFRVRGDVLEIYPPYEDHAVRVEFLATARWSGSAASTRSAATCSRRSTSGCRSTRRRTTSSRAASSTRRWSTSARSSTSGSWSSNAAGKLLEAQRLSQRTLLRPRHAQGAGLLLRHRKLLPPPDAAKGRRPAADAARLLPRRLAAGGGRVARLTVPQARGMYHGDRSRKETLVEFGFRLPSALDNRPLTFEEFEGRIHQALLVSATPGPYELQLTGGEVVEQLIRPTGLLDPQIVVKPAAGQVDDLLARIRERVADGERVLVTTLTKRMAEDLTQYFAELGVRVRYLHSEVETLERTAILADLRRGTFDVLVGINLLREGLDLPEVSLVAILDADKEGYLRSSTSLIQTIGRAARNVNGTVILYADRMTDSLHQGDRRDRTPAREAGGVQPRARHRAEDDHQGYREPVAATVEPRLPRCGVPAAATG